MPVASIKNRNESVPLRDGLQDLNTLTSASAHENLGFLERVELAARAIGLQVALKHLEDGGTPSSIEEITERLTRFERQAIAYKGAFGNAYPIVLGRIEAAWLYSRVDPGYSANSYRELLEYFARPDSIVPPLSMFGEMSRVLERGYVSGQISSAQLEETLGAAAKFFETIQNSVRHAELYRVGQEMLQTSSLMVFVRSEDLRTAVPLSVEAARGILVKCNSLSDLTSELVNNSDLVAATKHSSTALRLIVDPRVILSAPPTSEGKLLINVLSGLFITTARLNASQGRTELASNQYDLAIRALRLLVGGEKYIPLAQFGQAKVAQEEHRPAEALELLRACRKAFERPDFGPVEPYIASELRLRTGQALLKLNRAAEAESEILDARLAARDDSDFEKFAAPVIEHLHIICLLRLGRNEECARKCEILIQELEHDSDVSVLRLNTMRVLLSASVRTNDWNRASEVAAEIFDDLQLEKSVPKSDKIEVLIQLIPFLEERGDDARAQWGAQIVHEALSDGTDLEVSEHLLADWYRYRQKNADYLGLDKLAHDLEQSIQGLTDRQDLRANDSKLVDDLLRDISGTEPQAGE